MSPLINFSFKNFLNKNKLTAYGPPIWMNIIDFLETCLNISIKEINLNNLNLFCILEIVHLFPTILFDLYLVRICT